MPMTRFPNLADSRPSSRVRTTSIATTELASAGFYPLSVQLVPTREVMSDVVGVLMDAQGAIAVAYRRWYYWSVEVRRPLPLPDARWLNGRYFETLRAYGYSGGTDVVGPVDLYHVDTAEALRAMAEALCPPQDRVTPTDWYQLELCSDYMPSGEMACCSDPGVLP